MALKLKNISQATALFLSKKSNNTTTSNKSILKTKIAPQNYGANNYLNKRHKK